MTNPADILTDEFIERVAERIATGVRLDGVAGVTMYDGVFRISKRVLREEREPIQTIVFEVRASSHSHAVEHLIRQIKHDNWQARSDIYLCEEPLIDYKPACSRCPSFGGDGPYCDECPGKPKASE